MAEDETIKSRLTALIKAVLEESRFDPTIKRIVSSMIINFLKSARDEDLKIRIEELRDAIIPFILTGKAESENAKPTEDTHPNG